MISFIQRALTRVLIFVTIPFFIASTIANAGTLGGGTSYGGWTGWTFSYELMQLTRANITLEDGTIIAAPTFDITENAESFTTNTDGTITGTGSALFTGIMKVTHGPEPGEAWAKVQMQWPEVVITITPETISAQDSEGTTFSFIKESRVYTVTLSDSVSNADKLTDGFKQVQPGLPRTGVYLICDGTNDSHLCYQEIGYGTVAFNPSDIFSPVTAASGLPVAANIGFYWDEVCTAFPPEALDVQVDGVDFILEEDTDGYFRTCEGRSVVARTCTLNPDADLDTDGNPIFNCNDINEDGQYFTLAVTDAAAGDRIEPAPATTCIGTDVADWLALSAYSGSGEDLIITPCDPNQGFMLLPYTFTDSSIAFTSSEGGGVQIDDIHIIGISSGPLQETAVYIQESPDKTNSVWDLSNMQMNVLYISGLELDDSITGTASTDVILGGNGGDSLYGFSGSDCIDGGQNDDHLWGDSHPLNNDADTDNDRDVTRGADVFVLNSKLGKDTIYDFSAEDGDGDMIVNTSNASATITDNNDGSYTVALKGQNNVLVHVVDGVLEKGVNVVDAPLSGFPACNGYPQ